MNVIASSSSPRSPSGAGRYLRLQVRQMLLPILLYLVVHAHGGRLINGDHHRLAFVSATREVGDDILCDLFEALIPGNKVVLAPEFPFQLPLLLLIQFRIFEEPLHVLVEVLVRELHFWYSVLVVQRNGVLVFDGLAEVINTDVIAEYLPRLLLPSHERRPREPDECGVRQGVPHIEREKVVLRPVCFVRYHDDVGTIRQFRVRLAVLCSEFLDEGKQEPVVFLSSCLRCSPLCARARSSGSVTTPTPAKFL